jgi:beta-galactosidase
MGKLVICTRVVPLVFRPYMLLLLLSAAFGSILAGAQQTEPSLPFSQRLTINLASGMPEYVAGASSVSSAPQSNWWFENTRNN